MEIQKGLVKDQGYPDVTCTYGTCADGTIYYFIENGNLDNGNIIVSTNLKEAIGHAAHNFLGVINSNGDVVIPCENKIIKKITEKLLLVEKTNPTSENVIEAMKDRADPLAANKLVSTAASIKEKLNGKIGRDGKFVFNNQFSEASIFDFAGNNVIDDFYSYIAMDDDTIYFSKNNMDTEIVEYSINAPVNIANVVVNKAVPASVAVEQDVVVSVEPALDVTNTGITKEAIDKQIEEETKGFDAPVVDSSINDVVNVPASVDVVPTNVDINIPKVEEDKDVTVPAMPTTYGNAKEEVDMPVEETVEDKKVVDMPVEKEEVVSKEESPVEEEKVVSKEESPVEEEKVVSKEVTSVDEEKVINFNDFKNEPLASEDVTKVFDNKYEEPDTVIESANNVMKELIKQNKAQRDVMKDQDSKIEILENDNKLLTEQCEDVNNENDDLKRKVTRYEAIIEKYAKKLNNLSEKVESQTKTISEQQKRLDILEPQIAGRNQLGNTVEEALEILNDDEMDNVYTKSFVA